MKSKTHFLSFVILSIIAVIIAFVPNASAEIPKGNCGADGDNVTYTFDTKAGVLEIKGTGAMADYYSPFDDIPWYSKKEFIKTVAIGKGVTSIGWGAFANCSGLTSINIPDGITSIGNSAFYDCSALASITIPNSVKSIGVRAFYRCRSLASISIPNSVTIVGNFAFSMCTNLTSITIPNGVTHIGAYAFHRCNNLTSLTIPDTVTRIEEKAFAECNKLTSIYCYINSASDIYFDDKRYNKIYLDLPVEIFSIKCGSNATWSLNTQTGVMTIEGTGAMWDCGRFESGYLPPPGFAESSIDYRKYIKKVIISSGITSIGFCAFGDNINLIEITIPESVKYIDFNAFSGSTSLSTICLYKNSYADIFFDSNKYTKIYLNDTPDSPISEFEYTIDSDNRGIKIIEYNGKSKNVKVPEQINGLPVRRIANGAFSNSSIESITLPKSIYSIGYKAFSGSEKLKKVTMQEGLAEIDYAAFAGCTSLSDISLPSSLISVGGAAFANCSSLKNIVVPNNVTGIGYCVFYQSGLTSITIPNSVSVIGEMALWCGSLKQINFVGTSTEWKNILKQQNWCQNSDITCEFLKSSQVYSSAPIAFKKMGRLDSYDPNGSAVIDGVKYRFSNAFKNSTFNISSENENAIVWEYVLFNLNSTNQIEHLFRLKSASHFTIDSIKSTMIKTADSNEEYGILGIEYGINSFLSPSQLNEYVDTNVITFYLNSEIYKIVSVEKISGKETSAQFLSKPQLVYIEKTQYPIYDALPELSNTVATAQFKYADFVLYDGVVVSVSDIHDRSTVVYINNATSIYYVGEEISITVMERKTYPNGDIKYENNKNVSFNISNPDSAVSLKKQSNNDLSLLAETIGATIIYIINNYTGEEFSLPIVIAEDAVAGIRANDVTEYEWNCMGYKDRYNAIIDGMVIADFRFKKDGEYYHFFFNVYNRSSLTGVIEVYDSDDKLVDLRMIGRTTLPDGLASTFDTTGQMLICTFLGEGFLSFRNGATETSFIDDPIIVPKDGYIKISNSCSTSVPCLLLNCFDITLDVISLLKGMVPSAEDVPETQQKTILTEITKLMRSEEERAKIFNELKESFIKGISKQGIVDLFVDISSITERICPILRASVIDTTTDTALEIVETVLKQPQFGTALKIVFDYTTTANIITQMHQFSNSLFSVNNMTIATPNDRSLTVLSSSCGIKLQSSTAFAQSALLCSNELSYYLSSKYNDYDTISNNDYIAYDVSIVSSNNQPENKSTYTLIFEVPDFEEEKISLYRENNNGSFEKIEYEIVENSIRAEVDCFGVFVISDGELNEKYIEDSSQQSNIHSRLTSVVYNHWGYLSLGMLTILTMMFFLRLFKKRH